MVVCFSTLANPVGFLTCWLLMWFAGTRCTAPVAAVRSGWQSMDWCSMIMILMWRTAPRNRRRYWLMHDIQHSKGFFFRSVQYFAPDFTDFYAKQFWSCLPEAFDLTVLCFMHTGRSHKECLFRSSFWKTHIIWDGLHSSFLFETYLLNWIVLVNQWGEWGVGGCKNGSETLSRPPDPFHVSLPISGNKSSKLIFLTEEIYLQTLVANLCTHFQKWNAYSTFSLL